MENQRALAAKQFIKNQAKKASDYFKPTEKVRARDVVRELPGAVAQTFSGTRDTVVKGGKILGEGLAYATSPNVRKMYQAGNTDILPTVSNTTPRQMLANTAKSAFEIAPVGKIRGLATAAMSAKLAPRMIAGGAMGYGYDVADKMSRQEDISQSTFHPGIATLAGALMGGMSRPTSEMLGQAGREIGDDVRNINPANRLSRKVVDKYDHEPVPGVFAPGGIQQQRPIMESFRKEVETTQMPFEPQSSIARFLMGKQKVGMGIEPQNPLLQEAGKAPKNLDELFNDPTNADLFKPAKPVGNSFQDTLPSRTRPSSVKEIVKSGGNPLYHDTNSNGVLGILDSGEIKTHQAPFGQLAGQGKRVSTTRNFDNYSRYHNSPYRFVIDESKTGQRAIADNREEFESIFRKNVSTKAVNSLAIDITNPELITDIKTGKFAEVIKKAKEKGIKIETFEGKILPDEYSNKEIQGLTKKEVESQLIDLYNKAQGNNKK